MTTAAMPNKALLAAPKDPDAPASATMVAVARKYGISPFRQMKEMFWLRFGPGKIALAEYYANGLYEPDLPADDKREYVGRIGSWELNDRMSPAPLTETRAFVREKVMYTALLQRLGLPTTETQAVAVDGRSFGDIPALRSPQEARDFLLTRAEFPVFGKPCEGYASVGSVLLTGIEGDEVVMGNDRRAPLEAFCREMFEDYPEGFILQKALEQHPDMTRVIGRSVGTLRMVTVRDEVWPRMLYTVWKVPSPDAMSDNFWQAGSMVARVDDEGRVGLCRRGTGLDGHWIEEHPVTGERFDSVSIPHWAEARRVACEAHALFPEFGIIGWDMAITPDGPVIVEANDNPFHVLWQLANGRGIRNADFMPAFDAAAARSQAILSARVAKFRERQRAKGRRA